MRKKFWMTLTVAGGVACGLFFLRGGRQRPLFALADAFSISGFFLLLFSLLPRVLGCEAFDGFCYAFRCGWQGIFPVKKVVYDEFKKARRGKGLPVVRNSGVWVGAAFFSAGILFSLFFL